MGELDTFPLSYKVKGRRIVIVGGGEGALNKARLAAKTSASILVVCARIESDFSGLPVTVAARAFASADLDGAALVFVADHDADGEAAKLATRQRGIPLNVVDAAAECDFYTPSIIARAPVSIAISSEGAAPVLARLLRARIEAVLAPDIGALAALAGALRDSVARLLPGVSARRYYEALFTSPAIVAALQGGAGREAAQALLEQHAQAAPEDGIVWLIGAGPGATDLLTLRAQRLLQAADVIVHDQFVPGEIIDMGRRDATRIAVGGRVGQRAQTMALLVRLARQGRRVARLKGGDAMAFGRAGEEIAALRRAGIAWEVVPGVSAAVAAGGWSDAGAPAAGIDRAA